MASLSSLACAGIRCSTSQKNHYPNRKQTDLSTGQKINEDAFSRSLSSTENLFPSNHKNRQNIPTKKQLVDPFRQAVITEEVIYKQTMVIRSSEVGPDEIATIESILSLLQETALNHAWMTGDFCGGSGAGSTNGMMRKSLIWVLTRMHVQVDCYPIWGEVIEIETWVRASGKNGMQREWLLKSHSTGHIYARATSKCVMMNTQTRRISKIPEDVMRLEVSPWFIEKRAFQEEVQEKIDKLDQNAKHIVSGLKPRWSDFDMNQHVNNVKYARWMLESIPEEFLKNHQLINITMEYKKECNISDVVQSLSQPQEDGIFENQVLNNGNGQGQPFNSKAFRSYTHQLRTEGATKNEEIVRGRTRWKRWKKMN